MSETRSPLLWYFSVVSMEAGKDLELTAWPYPSMLPLVKSMTAYTTSSRHGSV
jgi:hypothetical protein